MNHIIDLVIVVLTVIILVYEYKEIKNKLDEQYNKKEGDSDD